MNPTCSILSSAVLPLRLTFADGYRLLASASVVGTNDLLTATHVLYQPQHGGWATGLALLGTQGAADGQVRLTGEATPISGWQVWANPQQVYADNDPTTLTLGESQYDVALIGVDRRLDQTGLTLADHAGARQGSGLGYAGGQRLSGIDTDLQHGQDGYSVWGSANSALGPGSSGGPLLDEAGQIIGINSAGTPGSATWWADIAPFLPQITEQMQANDGLLLDTGLNNSTGPRQISTGASLPALLPTGQETVGAQLPNAIATTNMVGGEVRVNTYTQYSQQSTSIAALHNGGFVIAWTSFLEDGDGGGIYFQRFSNNGEKIGSETKVNTYTANTQQQSSVTALNDGGYIVTWASDGQDGSYWGIYSQRYSANGDPVGAEVQINKTTYAGQFLPTVASLNDGGYVITWTSDAQDGSGYGVYLQRYNNSGLPVGNETQINSNAVNHQYWSVITGTKDGGYVVAWHSLNQDGSDYGIYAQRYSNTSALIGNEVLINKTTANAQSFPAISALNDGGYLIAWNSMGQDNSGNGVYAQRFDSNGQRMGGEQQVNSTSIYDQQSPSIAPMADGGYVITWMSDQQDGSSWGVYAQRYASNGTPIGGETRVNSFTANWQDEPEVAALSDSNYVITWQSAEQDGSSWGIYAQRFSASYTQAGIDLSADASSLLEGTGSGTTPVSFTLTRTGPTTGAVSVDWAVQHGTTNAADFSGATNGAVSFAVGETSKQITLLINKDSDVEPDESFTVALSNAVDVVVGTGSATQTIANDDSLGSLSISAVTSTVTEGSSGGSTPVSFTVSRSGSTGSSASVNWAVQHATTDAADFNGATSGTVYFNPGETSKTIALNLNADTSVEQNETFNVVLSNASNASIVTGSASQTIGNDDNPAGISIRASNSSVDEGSGGGITPVTFDISRDNGNGSASVNWAFQPGTATADDLSGATGGTVYFNPGETSKQITLNINRDNVSESDEAFSVVLSNPANAQLGTSSATQTIRDDDVNPDSTTVTIRSQTTSLTEGNGGGSTLMSFEIARTGVTTRSASVDWAIQPGSTDASDFSGITSGSVSFAPGETSKSLQIAINRDNVYEPDETFSIALKNPVGAVIGTASISASIKNDDAATLAEGVLYRFAKLNGNYFYTANPDEIQYIQDNYLDMMRFEGYAFNCLKGSGQAVYRYALLGNGGGYFYTADTQERQYLAQHPETYRAEGVVNGVQQPAFYAALDNDQSATAVYRLKNGNGGYLFTASDAEKDAAIGQYGYTYEQIAFKVPTAGTPSGFALAAGQDSQFAAEGSGTGGSLKYTVLRIGDASGSASVQWSVKGTGANPTEADDFVGAISGTLSFGANETAKTLSLQFNGDSAYGTDETFSVILSNPQGEPILVGSMAGRIVNDDSLAPKGGITESAYEGPLLHAAQLHPELPLVGGALAEAGWW